MILPALLLLAPALIAQEIPEVSRVIEEAIAKKQIPGAVALISHNGKTIHRKAYGLRSLEHPGERMTLDTIFDAASLTKVIATTSSIAKLYEGGWIDLDKPVAVYLPTYEFNAITVRELLTHYSGLRPDLDLEPPWSGYQTGIEKALLDKPTGPPSARFVYSDINFELLGEIVHTRSGFPLDQYAKREIFDPLGMTDTMFNPPPSLRARIAPTEREPGSAESLRGIVHDPTARYMGGVAGHAGMFTTAGDLAKFARMMLDDGGDVFRKATVRLFTRPNSPLGMTAVRGLGWDIDTTYSSPRGDLFPTGGFGHTGFTGTSLWMDPESQSFVILLTNAVHPRRGQPISALRRAVATAAAQAVSRGETLTGLDVLAAQAFAPFKGKRVGLITNHTGLTRDGKRNIDAMLAAGVKLTALYSPEHGIGGKEDHENIGNAKDQKTGLPIWSLYHGEDRSPSSASLANIDLLVFDIQDIGARYYTYLSTLVNAMEVAAKRKLPLYVLDRPNPITGEHVEGPMLDPDKLSFVGIRPLPLRHGMTLGELAKMINAELSPSAKLEVVTMKGWTRSYWWDQTGLVWVNPSPNMKSAAAALLYPGIAQLEYNKNYSVGRGTDTPFERITADWINGTQLADYLNTRFIPGIRVYPIQNGVQFVVTDRNKVQATFLGVEVAAALLKLYPGKIDIDACWKLIGNQATMNALKRGDDPRSIRKEWNLDTFLARRKQYLLYD
jgi:uncharacterized protein YbbC (DUF1343 family)/CubicO group peptidase (beta-lactamase class C family)